VVVVADTLFRFLDRELAVGLGNGALAMHPLGLNPIKPGTFTWQRTHQQPTTACLLDPTVMALDPAAHFAAGMPRGIVPDDQQGLFLFLGQPLGQPAQELGRAATHRATVDKAQEHGLCIRPQHAIAGYGFGLQVLRVRLLLDQASRLRGGPGVQAWLGQTAPPDLIGKAQHP